MDFREDFYEDEVRNGFYIPSLMKRNWAAGLEVLSEIDKICKKYNLQWFMAFGTLLGAVRHKGFIPWDDDLDIMMKRKDFEEFQKHSSELPANYVVATPHDLDDYDCPMMSVNNALSPVIKSDQIERHHGFPFNVGIDVYMLDGVSENSEEEFQRMSYINVLQNLRDVYENVSAEELDALLKDISSTFGHEFDREKPLKQQIVQQIDLALAQFSDRDTKKLIYMDTLSLDGAIIYDADVFKDVIQLPFEGKLLPASPEYDKLLKDTYGDYISIVKGDSYHNYPIYKKWEKCVLDSGAELPYLYKFDPEALKHARPARKTIKEKSNGKLGNLKKLCSLARKALEVGDIMEFPEIMSLCQSEALNFGNELERTLISPEPVVEALEKFCETAYEIYEGVKGIAESIESENKDDLVTKLFSAISEMKNRIDYVDAALSEAETKKEIVLLPFKASAWETMKPYWEKYKDDSTVNLHVVPIPYRLRGRDASLGSEVYEGEALAEKVPIEDYRTFPFVELKPQVIVIQNPYDEYSMGSEVNRYFFSDNLKKLCDELVYIPWFETDDIDIDDEKCKLDVQNMRHYVTVPGCVSADLIYVPTENLRKTYIRVLTDFAGDETKERWESCVNVMAGK